MVRKLLIQLDKMNLLASVFSDDPSILYFHERPTEDLHDILQAVVSDCKRDQTIAFTSKQLGDVLSQLMVDFPQNFGELVQLIKLKDVVEAKARRKSAAKRCRRKVALQKLESNFEANFSQREMLLYLAENIMKSLVVLLCQDKVSVCL